MKKDVIKRVGLEMFSVVFAVLLALALNHWREERSKQQVADQSLTNILVEIHHNKSELEGELADAKIMIANLEELQEKLKKGEEKQGSLGFTMPLLSNSAWQTANSTGAVERFQLTLLIDLSTLYNFQEMYQDHGMQFFNMFGSLEFNKAENFDASVAANIAHLKNSLSLREQLLSAYERFLDENQQKISPYLPDSLQITP